MNSLRYSCITLYLIISAVSSFADETTSAQLTQLENGIRLLVLPQTEEQLVQVDVYLSLRGAARNGGMAHFVEHLMFRSTKFSPAGSLRDSFQLLATKRGGSTTPRNIKTKTRCLPGQLPRLLAVEAERFGHLLPDQIDVDHEKLRVIGEYDFRKELHPGAGLALRIIAMAYEEEGMGDPLLGDPEMIRAMTMAQAKHFISRWFRPDRIVVLVSGPVDPDEVLGIMKETFGAIPAVDEELILEDLPPHPGARQFVTSSSDNYDRLKVGFRLPYGNYEESAIVHLTETIMERERGYPHLYIFEDEALLIASVNGRWSTDKTDEEAVASALEQFWKDFKKVKRRIKNDWKFERNRAANVKGLRGRINNPFRSAIWRAQRLADDRELPDPEVMAAMIDTLDQGVISDFFGEQFTEERAFTAFAAGRKEEDAVKLYWERNSRLKVNPYLNHVAKASEAGALSVADAAPVLARAAASGVGRFKTAVLPNGTPLYVLNIPHSDEVYLGGVKTFPCLEDEAADQNPGRLLVYRRMANWGYDSKGEAIEPVGQRLSRNTYMYVDVNSLTITADGPAENFTNVAEVMHKRVDVSRIHPYFLKWYVEKNMEFVDKRREIPGLQSWIWKTQKIYGTGHPYANWLAPQEKSITEWDIGMVNRLHWKLWMTGNLQLVVAGGVGLEESAELLSGNFGQRREAEPVVVPLDFNSEFKIEGKVIHLEGSSVAKIQFMFPPQAIDENSSLGAADFLVMESILTSRLKSAFQTAGLDSVNTNGMIFSAGYSALPYVRATCKPEYARDVMDVICGEMLRLQREQPTDNEEATARLEVLGPLVETLTDPESARDFFVDLGGFGKLPEDILNDLCSREYGVLTAQMANYFNAEQHVWTVLGDRETELIRDLDKYKK